MPSIKTSTDLAVAIERGLYVNLYGCKYRLYTVGYNGTDHLYQGVRDTFRAWTMPLTSKEMLSRAELGNIDLSNTSESECD